MRIIAISGSQIPSNVANSLQAMKAVHALAQLGHTVTLIVPVTDQPHSNWGELAAFYGLQKEFRVEYTIEYPNDLPARKAAAGAAPAPLQMQIESLERKF